MHVWEKRCELCGEVKLYLYFCRPERCIGELLPSKFTNQCRACVERPHDCFSEQGTRTLYRKTSLWTMCLGYWQHQCAVCGRPKQPGLHLAADHWQPYADGNLLSPLNILPLCQGKQGCNNSKRNRDSNWWLTYWLGEEKGGAKQAEIEAYFKWVAEQEAQGYLSL